MPVEKAYIIKSFLQEVAGFMIISIGRYANFAVYRYSTDPILGLRIQ